MSQQLERFKSLPRSLQANARTVRLPGDVPALLVHPDWEKPAPVVVWMHGRTVFKELDPGRYLRWMRAGIGACAIDLPGHGERYGAALTHPRSSPDVIERATAEIDGVVDGLLGGEFAGMFQKHAIGIGGMSLGGMVALRRLCDENSFRAAAVESTTGALTRLWSGADSDDGSWPVDHPEELTRRVDPALRLDRFRPLPLLALHSEADQVVPWAGQLAFLEALRERYRDAGADPAMVEQLTWPTTGASDEHSGFGKVSNDAKNAQTEFFARTLPGE